MRKFLHVLQKHHSKVWYRRRTLNCTRPLTTAVCCFETENLYSWGTRCAIGVEFVVALLPLLSICIVALINFFSIIENFSFQRSIVPQSYYVTFLEASASFHNSLYFDTEIVTSSSSVLLCFRATYEKLFGISCSFFTAPKVPRPAFDDWSRGEDLFKIDFILLNVSQHSLDIRPIEDKRCLKSGVLILGEFIWSRDILASRASDNCNGRRSVTFVKNRFSERKYLSTSSSSLSHSRRYLAGGDSEKHLCGAFF